MSHSCANRKTGYDAQCEQKQEPGRKHRNDGNNLLVLLNIKYHQCYWLNLIDLAHISAL